ncbi:uncharacterized protein LOC127289664 [Leptopilina boulardi]|uniref:uncharacterized protein LOC127289664 n=1 Tax=Leptopilina boulardi TaxID=63433 RepID=UPI0021F53E06|nr:uncharacterized protein LOC127289664 [Leptopilina boulardi]
MVQYNSQGIGNVRKNWNLLKDADILVIQETFLEKEKMDKVTNTLDKKFSWSGKAAVRAGDFNARIGEGQGVAECGLEEVNEVPARKSEDKEIRSEGKKLLQWCEERAIIIMNGRMEGDIEGKITCIGHGSGLGSVLDLVLVKTEEQNIPDWFKGLKVSAQEGSDHLPILYRVSWESKNRTQTKTIHVKKKGRLRWKKEKEESFREACKASWGSLLLNEKDQDIENRWDKIKRVIQEAAKKSGMYKKGNKTGNNYNGWDNGQYKEMRRKLFKLLYKFRKTRNWKNKVEYIKVRKALKKLREKLIKEWLEDKRRRVEKSRNLTEWWESMRWFRKRRKIVENSITKEEWARHFTNLLNDAENLIVENGRIEEMVESEEMQHQEEKNDGIHNAVPDEYNEEISLDKPIEHEEIIAALRNLKSGKAAGEDGISAEFLKNLPVEIFTEVSEAIKEIWEKGQLKNEWRTSMIFTIYKNGDVNETGNYRGISLLDIGYKILATIMANRLKNWLEENEVISEAQAGFRMKRGAMEQVYVLNTIIGNRLKQKEDDFKRKKVGGTAFGTSETKGLKIYTLLYADDVALIAEDGKALREMMIILEKWTDRNLMEVDTKKTKIMVFRRGGRRKKEKWTYKKEEIEVVTEFK